MGRGAAVGALTRAHCVSPTAAGRRSLCLPKMPRFLATPRRAPRGFCLQEVNHVTITRTTIAGALAINVPSIYWATVLPTAVLVISIVTLAGIGALLGAFTGYAV